MISKLDFEEGGLMDPMIDEKTWKDCVKPHNLFNTPAKCAAVSLGTVLTLIIIAALFATDIRSSALQLLNNDVPDWSQLDTLFAFGDSYTSYLKSERYEDPPWKCKKLAEEGRYRTKPNWITFITEAYNKTEMRAVDFAVGGSTVDGAIVSPYAMGSSLKDFVNDFQGSYGDWTETPGFKWKSEKSLFTFWFGVNDIAISHFEAKHGEEYTRAPLPEVFESYMRSLNTLYDAGARNFLILTCPPFDRSTIDIRDSWYAQRHLLAITDISSFNSRIYDMLYAFRLNHTDAHGSVFDAHRLFASVLDHPRDFPATDGVHNFTGVCREADPEDQPGPLDVVYEQNICRRGELIQSYAWTGLHATYPVHNATAAQIVLDCFGGDGNGEFCT